jgi:hypothetical protein
LANVPWHRRTYSVCEVLSTIQSPPLDLSSCDLVYVMRFVTEATKASSIGRQHSGSWPSLEYVKPGPQRSPHTPPLDVRTPKYEYVHVYWRPAIHVQRCCKHPWSTVTAAGSGPVRSARDIGSSIDVWYEVVRLPLVGSGSHRRGARPIIPFDRLVWAQG